PSVFPSILCSFTKIFRFIINKVYSRFKARGLKGLSIALVEGVSAFNRLGSYYFIGFPKSLIGLIFSLLGIIDSI
ncbi:uncharacterized protein K441DRAFT_598993, partial [Cenococcum geophilum 1.58]